MSTATTEETLYEKHVKIRPSWRPDKAIKIEHADYPAHIERLLINTYAYRETLARKAFNEAYRQQHPRFATGLMLDLCGDDVNTPRLEASAARCTIRFTLATSKAEPVLIAQGTQVAAGATASS